MKTRSIRTFTRLAEHRMSDGFTARSMRSDASFSIDPFLSLDHFHMSQPTFPPHPHAGFSAVTYMFEDSPGSFTNRDSLGDTSLITPGTLHWTQAGSGMVHEEIPKQRGVDCHGVQMFVNLHSAHKHAVPQAFHVNSDDISEAKPSVGVRVRVLAGAFGDVASKLPLLLTSVSLLDVHVAEGARVVIPTKKANTAFAMSIGGAGFIGDDRRAIDAHVGVGFGDDGDQIVVEGGRGGLHLLVGGGPPLREPVVFGGPFAMTNEADIADAYARYRGGSMGKLEPSF
jgi:redox-sensitive bicupin YhaK (pirin superfamily)